MLNSYAKTHIGQRKVNEDCFLIDEELGLYIVADGVGGLKKGEVASTLACKIIQESILSGESLKESVYIAHRAVINEIKENKEKQGMATTIVALLFNEDAYDIAWVGDSRVYIWDDGLKLLTKDDSYVELLLENGHIGFEDLETHPDRNVISQALGIERKNITINSNSGVLKDEQVLLTCTDGLYTIAKEMDMINSIKQTRELEELTGSLVSIAVNKQGKDNITLLSIKTDSKREILELEKPRIYREFDIKTGQIIGNNTVSGENDEVENEDKSAKEEKDPDLVDQTQLKDLTEDELSLINNAILPEEEQNNNNQFVSILIVFLIIFLLLIAFILLK